MVGRAFNAVLAALVVAGAAAPAFAADRLYYVYDPDSASAKLFTGVTTFVVKKGLFGKTPLEMFGQNGKSVSLGGDAERPFSIDEAADLVKAGKNEPISLYAVGGADGGKGFAKAACAGAERAWLVTTPFEPHTKLKVQVIGWNAEKKAAFFCTQLDFRYRGEYAAPKSGRVPVNDGNGAAKGW
ncbi:hypothetical protein [Caulobacter sp. 17J65-9]|uniref:hypothetical protein n=1 Tax=Caulobacter sp. 17J65-9 TaxID=2709382 RepID=UPI0013CD3303|nr:hypothetical protein [Caulobacter sp. 17J65-9]NEX94332.1 hypothetical protein [Caulobacter sp. 17J65-9]